MTEFNPCRKCDTCIRLCPVNAINEELPPPTGFSRDRCVQFIYKIRDITNRRIMFCGYCYNCCPVEEIAEKTFHLGRHKTLLDLNEHGREKLLETLNVNKTAYSI